MEAGSYDHDFECQLPDGLPTSFEGQFGSIRYRVRVVLDIVLWPNIEFKEGFTVIKPFDLNSDDELRVRTAYPFTLIEARNFIPSNRLQLPVTKDIDETFSPLYLLRCWQSEPMNVAARIPIGGYTPGQSIDVQVDVDNKSDRQADFSVKLRQVKCIQRHFVLFITLIFDILLTRNSSTMRMRIATHSIKKPS